MLKKTVFATILLIVLTVLTHQVYAASYVYSQGRRVVKACNLLLPGVGSVGYRAADYNAGVLGVLDSRLDLKPTGWDFVNPLSPPRVTAEIRNRYLGYFNMIEGQLISKDNPAYWDVELSSVTVNKLLQLDLVYLALPPGLSANIPPKQRELLRKLVDSGAQLWIDWGGQGSRPFPAGFTPCSGLFLPDVNFEPSSRAPGFVQSRHHPLLSYPYWLDQNEINSLGHPMAAGVVTNGSGGLPFPAVLSPVVRNGSPGGLPQVAAGRYGSGHIIMTANNIGSGIIGRIPGGVNPQFAAPHDLKFAYNVVAWGASYVTTFQGANRSSSAPFGPGAPLVERWSFPVGGAPGAAPVIYKGVVFHVDTQGRLIAFDGVPQQDLDGDGNPDDGIPDYSVGNNYDALWALDLGIQTSGPTICTWPGDPAGLFPAGMDVLLLTRQDGAVIGVPAFPMPLGVNPGFKIVMPASGAAYSLDKIPSPAYHNGIIYNVGGDGRLYCYDPISDEQWLLPGNDPANTLRLEARYSPPAVAWVQDSYNSAVDLMAYWTTGRSISSSPPPNDWLLSGLIAVRNESLRRTSSQTISTRYTGLRNFNSSGFNIWNLVSGGGCTDQTAFWAPDTGVPGQWQLQTGQSAPDNSPIFADYSLIRNQDPVVGLNLQPRTLHAYLPFSSTSPYVPEIRTSSPPAMAQDGTLYVSGQRAGVSQILALKENGSRNYGSTQDVATQPVTLEWTAFLGRCPDDPSGSFPGVDYTLDIVNDGGGFRLDRFQVFGPPAVSDDAVFVTAKGNDSVGREVQALLAFDRKNQFQIILSPSVSLRDADGSAYQVTIWQPNPFASTPGIQPEQEARNIPPQFIDYARKTITIDNFDNDAFKVAGQRPICAGLPIKVFVNNLEVPINTTRMDNLRWYFVVYAPDKEPDDPRLPLVAANRGVGEMSPPVVLGDFVYFGTSQGYVFGIRTAASPRRGKQLFGTVPNYVRATGDISAIESFKDTIRQNVVWQQVVFNPDGSRPQILSPIAGAGGLLAVAGSNRLLVFDSPTTLIVDNNRILEVDGGSQITWSLDASIEQNIRTDDANMLTGVSGKKTPFSRPSIARLVEGNSLVICDTGNDRVVRVDRAGNVQQEIREFVDPLKILSSGESLSLSGPSDVRTWVQAEKDPVFGVDAYIYHYLVVDRNNYRILDLIVRFDMAGRPLVADKSLSVNAVLAPGEKPPVVLNWASSSYADGRKLRYETAQLFSADSNTRMVVLTAVSNHSPKERAPGDTSFEFLADAQGGCLVQLNFAQIQGGAWQYVRPGGIYSVTGYVNNFGTPRRFANPRYVERVWVGPNQNDVHDIICDADGVWEIDQGGNVVWRLTSAQYMGNPSTTPTLPQRIGNAVIERRLVPLRARSAKILPNGRMLITNEFTGRGLGGGEFHGEVFEVDRKNPLTLTIMPTPSEIFWCAPAIEAGAPPKQVIRGTYNVEQPAFADRR